MAPVRPELRRLLFVLALLIVYVSLYPFRFRLMPLPFEPAWSRLDMVANILLFLPFGLLARWLAGVGPEAKPVSRNRLVLLLLAGAALAALLQALQVFVPGRQASLMDVGMNWIGLGLGAMAAPWLSPNRWQRLGRFWLDSRAGLLVLCWLAAQLSPFLPGNPLRAIERQLFTWQHFAWQFDVLATQTLAWLIVLCLLWPNVGRRAMLLLMACCLLPQTWLLGNTLMKEELLAPVMAALLFSCGVRSLWIMLIAAIVLLISRSLSPWQALATPMPFYWLPFGGLVQGAVPFSLAILMEKAFWYGVLYELGVRLGWQTRNWLLGLLLGLSVLECIQRWLPGHRAELTDPVLLLLMVLLLQSVAQRGPRLPDIDSRRR